MLEKLTEVRDWANTKLRADPPPPPWGWYTLMKLIDALDDIIANEKAKIREDSLLSEEPLATDDPPEA